ncbi:hypothetical protein RB2654_22123 [Rhodobacterales bacterium HTCC2654]|uniref:Uncharacterized protein n=1 Tax=Maritimibacter alkaliphilus HTCC2654 TaxID=314271 RepID=A3VJ23_9RHOB|nr:hypothetical protein RB2654_22123 [Rhodobacterales bacterium HTCC2654] [Maritimibacter alkaliphilus HTCC2654]
MRSEIRDFLQRDRAANRVSASQHREMAAVRNTTGPQAGRFEAEFAMVF